MNDNIDAPPRKLNITLLDEADHRDQVPVDDVEGRALARGGLVWLVAVLVVIAVIGALRAWYG